MFKAKTVVPLYRQLIDKIQYQIENEVYAPGDQLPPELEMAKQNGVSVVTVRKAINELVAEGLVEKKQGKGTFLTIKKYKRDFRNILSFSKACALQNVKPGCQVLQQTILPLSDELREALQVNDAKGVYISRLRFVDQHPVIIENSYFSMAFSFLIKEDLSASLFELLDSRMDVQIAKSSKVISIVRASQTEADTLALTKNHPLLLVKSIAYTADNHPVYTCSQIINGDKFELRF